MTNPTTLQLPKTTDELKEAIRKGIERYICSPVKKENKLNESLAASLGFSDYDSLSPLLKEDETTLTYSVDRVGSPCPQIEINGIIIKDIIFDEERSEYRLIDREEQLEELERWIGETYSSSHPNADINRIQMREAKEFLESIEDKFVWESINSGLDLVAASDDPKLFNAICEEIINLNNELNTDLEKKF